MRGGEDSTLEQPLRLVIILYEALCVRQRFDRRHARPMLTSRTRKLDGIVPDSQKKFRVCKL